MTKTLARTVGEGMAWTSASTFVLKGVGIAYSLTVLSQLTLYQYGVVELVLTLPVLLGLLNTPGLESVIVSDLAAEKANGRHQRARFIFESYVLLRTLLSAVAFCILFFGAAAIEEYYNEAIAMMIQIAAFAFIVGIPRGLMQMLFQTTLRFKESALFAVVEEISKLGIVLIALFYANLGPIGVVLAYTACTIPALLVFAPACVAACRELFPNTTHTKGLVQPWHTLLAHGKWGILAAYLAHLGQSVRLWLVKVFVGTEAVALFSVALGLYQHAASLFQLSKVINPIIPHYINDTPTLFRIVTKSVKYYAFANLCAGGFVAVAFPIIIYFLFPAYLPSLPLFYVMLAALIPAAFSAVFNGVFFALKAQRNLFVANTIRVACIVIVAPPLMFFFGFVGIALEFLLSSIVFTYERYRMLTRLLPGFKILPSVFFTFDETDALLMQKITQRIPFAHRLLDGMMGRL